MKLASKVNNIGIASRFYHICESSSRVNGTPLFCEVSTRQLSTWISFLYLSILAHYKILSNFAHNDCDKYGNIFLDRTAQADLQIESLL